ncbi:hypothetical protein QUB68_01870 [Microcoleus sp. A006_D1]|uniref:hypothetical protein n=1 Tax=Microcoleus sp. A006_D1 TaxID=3055267 RepID=UPI002FD09087
MAPILLWPIAGCSSGVSVPEMQLAVARDRPHNQCISASGDRAAPGSTVLQPKFLKFNP